MLVSVKSSLGDKISQTSVPNKESKTNCLPKNRIYLESCYTYIYFFNDELLEDILQIDTMLLGHTNTGTFKKNWLENYGVVEA